MSSTPPPLVSLATLAVAIKECKTDVLTTLCETIDAPLNRIDEGHYTLSKRTFVRAKEAKDKDPKSTEGQAADFLLAHAYEAKQLQNRNAPGQIADPTTPMPGQTTAIPPEPRWLRDLFSIVGLIHTQGLAPAEHFFPDLMRELTTGPEARIRVLGNPDRPTVQFSNKTIYALRTMAPALTKALYLAHCAEITERELERAPAHESKPSAPVPGPSAPEAPAAADSSLNEFIALTEKAHSFMAGFHWSPTKANADRLKQENPSLHEALFTQKNPFKAPYFVFPSPSIATTPAELNNLLRPMFPLAFRKGGAVNKSVAAVGVYFEIPEAIEQRLHEPAPQPEGRPQAAPATPAPNIGHASPPRPAKALVPAAAPAGNDQTRPPVGGGDIDTSTQGPEPSA